MDESKALAASPLLAQKNRADMQFKLNRHLLSKVKYYRQFFISSVKARSLVGVNIIEFISIIWK